MKQQSPYFDWQGPDDNRRNFSLIFMQEEHVHVLKHSLEKEKRHLSTLIMSMEKYRNIDNETATNYVAINQLLEIINEK